MTSCIAIIQSLKLLAKLIIIHKFFSILLALKKRYLGHILNTQKFAKEPLLHLRLCIPTEFTMSLIFLKILYLNANFPIKS